MKYLICLILSFGLTINLASARSMSVADVKKQIIQESIRDYQSTFAVCPCPYSKDKYGDECGENNAWTVSGHRTVYCYPADVPNDKVIEFLNRK